MRRVTERRRHKRFEMIGTRSKLASIERSGGDLRLEECTLIDISAGGIGFLTDKEFAEGDTNYFLIDLREPLQELVFVKVRAQWVKKQNERSLMVGASFLESSKGWLGELDSEH
jgi:PilZ domain